MIIEAEFYKCIIYTTYNARDIDLCGKYEILLIQTASSLGGWVDDVDVVTKSLDSGFKLNVYIYKDLCDLSSHH